MKYFKNTLIVEEFFTQLFNNPSRMRDLIENDTVEITGSNEDQWTFDGGSQTVARKEKGDAWELAEEDEASIQQK